MELSAYNALPAQKEQAACPYILWMLPSSSVAHEEAHV
jgi:hypothetical protein